MEDCVDQYRIHGQIIPKELEYWFEISNYYVIVWCFLDYDILLIHYILFSWSIHDKEITHPMLVLVKN